MPRTPPTVSIVGKLDAPEADDLYGTVEAWGATSRRSRCVIDLSGLQFVLPAGLTAVVQAVALLRGRGWSPSVRFPAHGDVAHYLGRMGLRRALKGLGRCIGAPRVTRRYATSSALVELTAISSAVDVDLLLGRITSKVAGILIDELEYSDADVSNFCNVISELARNSLDHSQSVGYVAAQRYTRSSDGQRFALLSVGDIGVGLRATLGERYPVHTWTDQDVIRNALLPQYSRHPNRGLGLAFVEKVCRDYRGSLHLRSGSFRLYVRQGRVMGVTTGFFPGTQIAISLQQRAA